MIKFAIVSPANKPKTPESQQVAYFYAGVITIMTLCQLFRFDEFLELLTDFNLPGGDATAYSIGGLIVTVGVFALPFLLRLKLSPAMRVFSMICGWLVPLMWLKLALWLIFTSNDITNLGILGTIAELTPGWWAALFSIGLGILSAWASWGLWPLPISNRTNK